MDHKNFEYFILTKMLNQRQARQAEFLSNFNFCIIYKPSNKAVRPDILNQKAENHPAYANLDNNKIKNRFQTIFLENVFDTIVFQDFIVQTNIDIDLTAALINMIIPNTDKSINDLIDKAYYSFEIIQIMLKAFKDPIIRD